MRVYKKSLTNKILLVLEKTVDGYVRLEDFTYHHYRYRYGIPELRKSSLSQALRRLREGGLIEQTKVKDDVIIKLTQAGKELISDNYEEKDWDGKWRIVIFDIPEQKRIIRNLFRRNLKKWGFKHLQKSVWVSKRNVFDKLELYIKDLGIEKWVVVMEVNRLTANTINTIL
ncbi:CRISPR-associated endonuclease Cas2 [Candidatus Daviesbacteria bacterium]|nr:CRISPR-associated endonuclease Cas2 [Candidatus Daviesbacteria bacterium]